jgi:hypothetical protein
MSLIGPPKGSGTGKACCKQVRRCAYISAVRRKQCVSIYTAWNEDEGKWLCENHDPAHAAVIAARRARLASRDAMRNAGRPRDAGGAGGAASGDHATPQRERSRQVRHDANAFAHEDAEAGVDWSDLDMSEEEYEARMAGVYARMQQGIPRGDEDEDEDDHGSDFRMLGVDERLQGRSA